MGVLVTRALLFGIDIGAPDFGKLPFVFVTVLTMTRTIDIIVITTIGIIELAWFVLSSLFWYWGFVVCCFKGHRSF